MENYVGTNKYYAGDIFLLLPRIEGALHVIGTCQFRENRKAMIALVLLFCNVLFQECCKCRKQLAIAFSWYCRGGGLHWTLLNKNIFCSVFFKHLIQPHYKFWRFLSKYLIQWCVIYFLVIIRTNATLKATGKNVANFKAKKILK